MNALPEIGLIGAGNVAWHLGPALRQAGLAVPMVFSRTLAHAQELAQALPGAFATASLDFSADAPGRLYLICVPDKALPQVVAQLRLPAGAVVAHTSGSQPLAVLEPLRAQGAATGVFYPLQTFTKGTPVQLAEVPLLLEADEPETLQQLHKVAERLSQRVAEVSTEQRAQLHLAAVFACNFTNHLLGISRELLGQAQLDHTLLQPLIRQTLEKALLHHPFAVQTGPAARYDQNTIYRHLEQLKGQPLLAELYRLLTRSIQQNASESVGLREGAEQNPDGV